ncbi:MAG: hypothetical protein U0Z44_17920 [Kouleothrix sp.]
MSTIASAAAQRVRPFRLGPLWPTDTKSIVGSVLLAVCFSINMQITERLDTLTGALIAPFTGALIANWLGFMFINLWFPVAVIYFGMTGALIVANFNPILAVLTATHALAWSFFFLNMALVGAELPGVPLLPAPAERAIDRALHRHLRGRPVHRLSRLLGADADRVPRRTWWAM